MRAHVFIATYYNVDTGDTLDRCIIMLDNEDTEEEKWRKVLEIALDDATDNTPHLLQSVKDAGHGRVWTDVK